jgi:hypothetical protein
MDELKAKILRGYSYHFKRIYPDGPLMDPSGLDRDISVMTGAGGAINIIDGCRKSGWTDEEIGECLCVYTDDWGKLTLNQVHVTQKDLEK